MTGPTFRFLPGLIASAILLAGPARPSAASAGWEENGTASWYGGSFQGRRTSSGAVFDQNAMTAAHPHLPLGSRVRVTLRDTGESVVVTINDRQPPQGRVIDLSRAAAARLGMVNRGLGRVHLAKLNADQPEEVAEAADDTASGVAGLSPRRRGRPHTHRASP